MNEPSTCDLIRDSRLTRDLSAEQCDELSAIAVTTKLADGEVLISQGDIDETLYIVGRGALAVERATSGGDTVTLSLLRSGDLAGAMGFVDGTEHSATLRSVGETTVVSLGRGDLESILKTRPELVYAVMRGIVRTVHAILRDMNLQSVELNNYISRTHGRY